LVFKTGKIKTKKMNYFKKIRNWIILSLIVFSFMSCSNARIGTHAGVNVVWGSNGPKLKPHMGVDVYNGGRRH